MNKALNLSTIQTQNIDRFHEIELEKAFDAILSSVNVRMQLGTFFGTVNLAGLSLAFSSQKAGLFLFSGVLLWVFMYLDVVAMRSFVLYCYRGLRLQARYAPDDPETLFNMILVNMPKRRTSRLYKITNLPEEQRLDALRTVSVKIPPRIGFWLALTASLIEIAMGIMLWLSFGWPLF